MSSSPFNNSNLIPFGKLVKPFGVKGEFNTILFNKESEIITENISVWIENIDLIEYKVQKFISTGKFCKIKFFEVSDRETASVLCNKLFYIDRLDFKRSDDIYLVDLIGCILKDSKNNEVGLIKDVLNLPTCDGLLVDYKEKEIIVPFLKDQVLFFDIDNSVLKLEFDLGFLQ